MWCKLDPAELLHRLLDGPELLDERDHLVFGVVELLGLLEHLDGLGAWDHYYTVFIGHDDVVGIDNYARARHRDIGSHEPVVIDGRRRRDAAAEYRKLEALDLRCIADRGVDHRPCQPAVLHRSGHQSAN